MTVLSSINATIIIPNFDIKTELNTLLLEQSEPQGHGHYLLLSYRLGLILLGLHVEDINMLL